jgi:hypothetical protein
MANKSDGIDNSHGTHLKKLLNNALHNPKGIIEFL